MCVRFAEPPYTVILKKELTKNGTEVMDYSLLLGKVTTKTSGEHRSSRGFVWPIGRTVRDPNARVGYHGYGLHYAASLSPANISTLSGYGSHPLAVLPAPEVWDPVNEDSKTPRCWHSSDGTTLFCLICDGIQLSVLDDPAFWQDLRRVRRCPSSLILPRLLTSNAVWHRQVEFHQN